jgi:hypothetical protein
LSKRLDSPVEIGRVSIGWPNRLALANVRVMERGASGRAMLEAGRIMADIDPAALVNRRVVFTTLRLFDFSISIRRSDGDSPLNIGRALEALARRDTARPPSKVEVDIRAALLRNGSISYDVASEPQTPGRFNAGHVAVYSLKGNVSLEVTGAGGFNARLSGLALKEKSGAELSRLAMSLAVNADSVTVTGCEVSMPGSRLSIPRAGVKLSRSDNTGGVPIAFELAPSTVALRDFAAFAPSLRNMPGAARVSAEADGDMNSFNLRSLNVAMDQDFLFDGQMSLKGVDRPNEAYLYGKVNRMFVTPEGARLLSAAAGNGSAELPEVVRRLGTVTFEGSISGFFDNMVAYGRANTAIGSIRTDILIGSNREKGADSYVRGRIWSSELLISELFGNGNPFGSARFDATINAVMPSGRPFTVDVAAGIREFDFRNYRYDNLQLAGRFVPGGFSGRMELDDPNGSLVAEGMFARNAGGGYAFDFAARLDHFRPDHLNLWDRLESPDISASVRADFRGSHLDDMEGGISVDSLTIRTAPSAFFMRNITLSVSDGASPPDKKLALESDIARGEVNGVYSFATILPGFVNTLESYAPALAKAAPAYSAEKENNFSFWLEISDTEALSSTLMLPVSVAGTARVTGHYNNMFDKFRFDVDAPLLSAGKAMVENCRVTCENPGDHIAFRLDAEGAVGEGRNKVELTATLKDNRMEAMLHLANGNARLFETRLAASAVFVNDDEEGRGLRADFRLHPSQFALNDSVWSVDEALVSAAGKKVNVSGFRISHNDRFLSVDGAVSDNPADTLAIELNRIELKYVFDLVDIPVLKFGGEMSGRFTAADLYRSRMIGASGARVDGFSFNGAHLGSLALSSRWDEGRQGILLNGVISDGDTSSTAVNGYIYPIGPSDGLDLRFDANNLNAGFLQEYMDGVVAGFRGRATGHVRLFGSFDDVDLEGRVAIRDGGLGIDFLNTYYAFADTVSLESCRIFMNNVSISDAYGNRGRIKSAELRHRFLHDVEFDIELDNIDNLLVYNADERQNPNLYGRVFASGGVELHGNEQIINVDVRLRNGPRTSIGINFMDNPTATAYDFIAFANRNAPSAGATQPKPAAPPADQGPEIRAGFQLDLAPDASIDFMMDATAGDKITGSGNASLQISYGSKTDLKIYGTMHIVKGEYNFSLQQLIRKNFAIREGSSVTFSGDPATASLNINAAHSLTANLGDLDPVLLSESPRTNVPVNCVMLIQGPFAHPAIAFDLELPGSNSELEQIVRSYVKTEDMLTRQIIYLLVLNTFHPSGFAQTTLPSEFNALTSAALSSQISGLLNSITDKVRIGTNIRTSQDGFNDTEVEMLLSSQMFDNRLLFNGNFGYRSNPTVKNVFVGEFDLEYLLTPTGEFRLKAYNHANDMYRYLKQSLTTQGFGFMYKKDFSSLSELFARRPRPLTVPRAGQTAPQTN